MEVVNPMPNVGRAAFAKMREEEPFHMPSVAELKKEAMQKAKEHMRNIAKGGCTTLTLTRTLIRPLTPTLN